MEAQGRIRSAEEWLAVGEQMKNAGVVFLLLTGGEPLLHPEFKDIYLGLKELGMILTINTNGTLLDEEWAAFFGRYRPRRINITLYGADERAYWELCHFPGGYERVVRAIRLLKEQSVDVRVGGSLTKANAADVEQILQAEQQFDVPVRIDTYMMPAVRERNKPFAEQSRVEPREAARIRIRALKEEMGLETFSQYCQQTLAEVAWIESQTDRKPEAVPMTCMAGKCSFTVNWQGELRPCVVMSGPARSVFDYGFEEAWRYVSEETRKILLNPKCSTCRLRPLCRTCAASALLETGSYDGVPDYMCQYAEESFRCLSETAE